MAANREGPFPFGPTSSGLRSSGGGGAESASRGREDRRDYDARNQHRGAREHLQFVRVGEKGAFGAVASSHFAGPPGSRRALNISRRRVRRAAISMLGRIRVENQEDANGTETARGLTWQSRIMKECERACEDVLTQININ